jgi:hypothetical protein
VGKAGNGHGSPWDLAWSLENLRMAQTQLEAIRQQVEGWAKASGVFLALVVEIQGAVNGAVGALDKACTDSQPPGGGKG